MSSSPSAKARGDTFVCDCGWFGRDACEGLPFYKKHEGKRYCVLHHPSNDKSAAFGEAFKRKLDEEDFNFQGVWFPDPLNFIGFTFTKPAYFSYATFTSVVTIHAAFSAEAYFNHATFAEVAYFNSSTFDSEAQFGNAIFGAEAYFSHVIFGAEAYFYSATFSAGTYFNSATFGAEADFDFAVFEDYVRFAGAFGKGEVKQVFGGKSSLRLQFARVEKPERLSFHTLTLRPHWFANVDARKFEFIDVDWNWRHLKTRREIESLKQHVSSPHKLLAISCRNLAVNAEENHRYEEASRFRYMAMEARRLESRRGSAPGKLSWWYWLASGYGERVWRAFVVLIGVWLVAAVLYTQVGFVRWEPRVSSEREAVETRRDEVGEPLRWQRALTYSLGVMTLQKPEPRPATNAAQTLVMVETILGPVQAALLALAIRRKFMR